MLLLAAAYAAAELLLTIVVGRYFDHGRAEALLFHGLRPWLLLAAALLVAARPWPERALLYLLALLIAAASETLLVLKLGASNSWPEALRGLLAGAMVALVIDLALQLGRRFSRVGSAVAAAGLALLMIVGGLRPYEAALRRGEPDQSGGEKPRLLMMSGLPLIWGEKGPFDPNWRPARSYSTLQQYYRVEPIDTIEPRTLGAGGILLLAQPQRLAPAELADLDRWIRKGGRALVLADPALAWPSELPPGDIRRPPPVSLLGPLLAHWGVSLEPPANAQRVAADWSGSRIVMDSPGALRLSGSECRGFAGHWSALCRLGSGKALLVSDADLLRDDLWAPVGPEADRRTADNPYVVVEWLDNLGGFDRAPPGGTVSWVDAGADRRLALLFAAVPILGLALFGLLLRRRRHA